ncbi:MAG TPA: lysophospholipid acyltransferase family protein [Fimbriimonas sp.]|nr:lysophospholipid acyltransferase family protein [Fimbriimonas sp.]
MNPGSSTGPEPKPNTLSRRFLRKFGEAIFLFFQKRIQRKSPQDAERAGERLAMFLYLVDKKHRKRTCANLRMAFPEWSEDRISTTAKEVFRHFGGIAGDFFRGPSRTNEEVVANMEVEGFHHYREAEALGRGVLMVSGHFGNWERCAHWLVTQGIQLSVITRETDDDGVQRRLSEMRESTGVKVLSRGDSARETLVRLRQKETIAILADQNTEEAYGHFFGKPAGTVLGPAVLHKRTGAVLLPGFCVRLGYGKYRVFFRPPIDVDNSAQEPLQVMEEVNRVLESVVREYPEQWLWMHDRWKSARKRGLLDS